jgi:mannose-6-phosphate isomerase-like protein (cupin superfamily)
MDIELSANIEKKTVFEAVKDYLEQNGFVVVNLDQNRPWGGFYVIDENQSQKFIDFFFSDVKEFGKRSGSEKTSPKILIVEKEKRLSWQYHHRRAELWKVIGGEVAVVTSDNDNESQRKIKKTNDIIVLKQGERHRLIGLDGWGIVAEIWQHTNKDEPSNEEDIVRLQDDFGR